MRVLVVHNRYSSRVPSGENLAVRDEVRWLGEAGVDVAVHEVDNDDALDVTGWRRAGQAMNAVWSLPAMRRLDRTVDQVRPDLVHVHNLFPLLSASVPAGALRRRLPVVWTVHNFRLDCVIGTHFRDGRPCHDCRPGWRVPGVRHACYGGSAAASALATAGTSIFRRVARRRLTAVAISTGIRSWLTGTVGVPPDRVRLKPNGVEPPPEGDRPVPGAARSRTFLFAGYLTDYKGVGHLLDAWRRVGPIHAELRVVGDGPQADRVRSAAAADPRITLVPQVPAEQMGGQLARARAVIVPSVWDEPFGRGAAEALAYRRPVITTGLGGLSEIVDDSSGWVTGRSVDRLAAAMQEAATSDDAVERRGTAGRSRWEQRFSPTATTRALVDIYRDVVHDRAADRGPAGRSRADRIDVEPGGRSR